MTSGRVVLLDSLKGRDAAALLVDGHLEELAIDPEGDSILPGAIYRAVADRPMKGQGGIFVKLPNGGSGFLRQISGISPGQRLLVQLAAKIDATVGQRDVRQLRGRFDGLATPFARLHQLIDQGIALDPAHGDHGHGRAVLVEIELLGLRHALRVRGKDHGCQHDGQQHVLTGFHERPPDSRCTPAPC